MPEKSPSRRSYAVALVASMALGTALAGAALAQTLSAPPPDVQNAVNAPVPAPAAAAPAPVSEPVLPPVVEQLYQESPPVPITQPAPSAPTLSVAPQSLNSSLGAEPPASSLTASAQGEGWTVNFKDASLQSFVQQISALTGENFIYPTPFNGKVNIASQTPLKKAELRQLMDTVLSLYGYSVVKTGKMQAIQPSEQAKKFQVPIDKTGKIEGQQFVTTVVPVKYANISDLLQALQLFLSDHGVVRGMSEVNSVLVADTADNVQKISQLIATIDNPDNQTVDLIPLANTHVGRLMPLLEKLAPRELAASAKKGGYSPIRVVADERRNVVVVRGEESERLRLRNLIQQLDKPADNEGQTKVIYLQNADAKDTAEMLKDFIKLTPAEAQAGTLSIKPNIALNALVVRGPQALMEEVQHIVSQIDIAPAQVLIEAVIVEVTDEVNNALGLEYAAGDAAVKGTLAAASLDPNGTGIANFIKALDTDPRNEVLANGGVTALFGVKNSFSVLVKALSATTKANLLSTPNITTLDNVEAKIVVGQNVPFRTGTYTTNTNGATNPFTTIERQDVGVTLKVTPQINSNNRVKLKVEQEVSSLQNTLTSGAADIITNKRTINTTILAENGGTVVLGGLISNDVTQSQSKVPLLGDIPLLGELFQSDGQNDKKRNLLVFLRPTVMRNKEDVESVNSRKFAGLWEISIGSQLPAKARGDVGADPSLEGYYDPRLEPTPLPPALPWQTPALPKPLPAPAAAGSAPIAPLNP